MSGAGPVRPPWHRPWAAGLAVAALALLPALLVMALAPAAVPLRAALDGAPALRVVAALLLGALALALASHEALALAWARGPLRQQQALAGFAQRIAQGHFDALAVPPAGAQDAELLALRVALRDIHDERARLHRVLAALREAETDRQRRQAFDTLRQAIEGDDHFADGGLALLPPPPAGRRPSLARLGAVVALAAAATALAGPWAA